VEDEYILVRRVELERLLKEIDAIKAIVAEEIRLVRSKPSVQASPSA